MRSKKEIEAKLASDVDNAIFRLKKARAEYTRVITASPIGSSTPESALQMTAAGAAERDAQQAVLKALKVMNEFLLDGIIPDGLTNQAEE